MQQLDYSNGNTVSRGPRWDVITKGHDQLQLSCETVASWERRDRLKLENHTVRSRRQGMAGEDTEAGKGLVGAVVICGVSDGTVITSTYESYV
jgi:hypothetical protein